MLKVLSDWNMRERFYVADMCIISYQAYGACFQLRPLDLKDRTVKSTELVTNTNRAIPQCLLLRHQGKVSVKLLQCDARATTITGTLLICSHIAVSSWQISAPTFKFPWLWLTQTYEKKTMELVEWCIFCTCHTTKREAALTTDQCNNHLS